MYPTEIFFSETIVYIKGLPKRQILHSHIKNVAKRTVSIVKYLLEYLLKYNGILMLKV